MLQPRVLDSLALQSWLPLPEVAAHNKVPGRRRGEPRSRLLPGLSSMSKTVKATRPAQASSGQLATLQCAIGRGNGSGSRFRRQKRCGSWLARCQSETKGNLLSPLVAHFTCLLSLILVALLLSMQPICLHAHQAQLEGGQPTDQSPGPFIKVTKFTVPSPVHLNDSARLTCLYQLQGATLYAMKLFKDDKEFYRFTPGSKQQRKQFFKVPGVQIDPRSSNHTGITLVNLNKQTAGSYKCQVTIEATFKSVSVERQMEVLESSSQQQGSIPGGSGARAKASTSARSSFFNHEPPLDSHLARPTVIHNQRGSNSAFTPLATGNAIPILILQLVVISWFQLLTLHHDHHHH